MNRDHFRANHQRIGSIFETIETDLPVIRPTALYNEGVNAKMKIPRSPE